MATESGVLRDHLARHARAAPAAAAPMPAGPPTATRMAAIAAARAARTVAGLAVICAGSHDGICSLAELPEHLPDHALLAIIEGGAGGDMDRLGVVALSPGMAAALIEMQTLGRLTATLPAPRKPTRADAALAADFIDAMLAGLGDAAQGAGIATLAGFRYASHLADPRPLGLMLEDRGFRTLRLDLRLGPLGEREGTIFLAAPLPADAPWLAPPEAATAEAVMTGAATTGNVMAGAAMTMPAAAGMALALPAAAAATATGEMPAAPPRATLAGAMRAAPITLHAILCRRRITLAELRALAPGALLALPRHALGEARLEAAGGHLLALGRLGEADGFHALRLLAPQAGRRTGAGPPQNSIEEPPLGDLAQPDAFRNPEAEDGLRNWQEALAEGRQNA